MPEFLPTLIAGLAIFLVLGLALTFPQTFGSQATGHALANSNGNGYDYFLVAENTALWTSERLKLNETVNVSRTHNHFATFKFMPEYYNSALLKIRVHDTNSEGRIVVLVNEKIVYAGKADDLVQVEFSNETLKEKNSVEVKAVNEGWMFWGEPIYVADIEIYGVKKSVVTEDFVMTRPRDATLKMFMMGEPKGEVSIMLNGLQLFSGKTGGYVEVDIPSGYFVEHNRIELIPSFDTFLDIDYAEIVFKQ